MHTAFSNLVLWWCGAMLGLLMAGCAGDTHGDRVPRIDLAVTTDLVLGTTDGEGWLAEPTAVCTDSEGHIYVADNQLLTVKKYGADGTYVTSIGREGDGPGEFRTLNDVFINERGELAVVGGRKLIHFTRNGEHLRTQSLDVVVRSARVLSGGDYLFVSQHRFKDEDSLLHVYDAERIESEARFASSEAFIESGNRVEDVTFQNVPGHVAVRDSAVIYVPYLYDGTLYRYAVDAAQPRRVGVWQGRTYEPPYTEVVSNAIERGQVEARMYIAGEHDRGVTYHSTSRGLFALEEGRLAHFTAVDSGDVRVLGVEVFDGDGRLVGYGGMDTVDLNEHGVPAGGFPMIAHRDDAGRFYLVWPGRREDVPHVQRVLLDVGSSRAFSYVEGGSHLNQ